MEKMEEVLFRVLRRMPSGVKPGGKTAAEFMAWHAEEGKKRSAQVDEENRKNKIRRLFSGSGISRLHSTCTFENYHAECEGQRKALEMAHDYAAAFPAVGGFIFSGRPGTGKNHLAAAIGNALIHRDKTVLIITVADIMLSLKSTFRKGATSDEEKTLAAYAAADLLVIDEIGVQLESRYEKVAINQIVDRRSSSKRPTGMLTNLNSSELYATLGERVMDRMKMGGIWISFSWESYRSKVSF